MILSEHTQQMSAPVLVVAAHADDEVLGMAGTIIRLARQAPVHLLFLTDGVGSRGHDLAAVAQRRSAAETAAAMLGATIHTWAGLPDNACDTRPLLDLVQVVERAVVALSPSRVFTHHPGDLNVDHRLAFQATLTACRPQPGASVQELYSFPVLSSSEWSHPALGGDFRADTYVDVSAELATILAAYDCYATEQRADPHARSRHALELALMHHGREVGCLAAERFATVRRVIASSSSGDRA